MTRRQKSYTEAISTLELSSGASIEEIKDAYRKLAKQYHPDVYKLDAGEKFKELSSAYRFLKKHPDPPGSPSYQNTQHYSSRPSQNDHVRKRRAYYRKKRASKAKQQKEMYAWLMRKMKPLVLIILIFNVLLSLDYLLLNTIEEKVLMRYSSSATRKSVFDGERVYEYSILLDDNHIYAFETKKRSHVRRGEHYSLKKTLLFETPIKLIRHKTGEELHPPYGIYNIFGVIIPLIFLLQYLYFYRVKNYDVRLGLVALMIISVLMQVGLTFF